MKNKKCFISVEEAFKEIKSGKMIIVVDSPDRENEGDLVCAAELITPQKINFMTKYARGLICVPMKHEHLKKLKIDDMVTASKEQKGCSFTVSVDYKIGTTTGISAYDRATTIKKLINETSSSNDFARPGHIFPLRYKEGGVLTRAGHTEAAIDLSEIAGLYPASVICEIMNSDGTMARIPDLIKFAKKHKLKIVTIEEIINYRRLKETSVKEIVSVSLPTKFGAFKLVLFEDSITKGSHIALIKGTVTNKQNVLVRVHSSCETGDVFHSLRCDCGEQMEKALLSIEQTGQGVFLYMHQEGRGIGLINKLKAYKLQESGMDTVEANVALGFAPDLRDYDIAAKILQLLDIKSVKLMTNNPKKIDGLKKYGLKVTQRIPIEIKSNKSNKKYLTVKRKKLGHLLSKNTLS